MNKISILHLTFNLGIGGAARTAQSFIKFSNKKLFEESVCCLGSSGPREKIIRKLGVKVYIANNNFERVKEIILEVSPDIIHLHFDGKTNKKLVDILTVAKSNNIKIVATNIFSYYDKTLDDLFDQHLFKSKMMLSVKFKRNSQLEKLPFSKYKVLYNPVDTNAFTKYQMTKREVESLKSKLFIPKGAPVIGRVGRSDVVKWGDLLLDAYPLILKEIPNCYLIIRGLPATRKSKIEKASWRNQVVILEETDVDYEVMQTYQLLDILSHASKIGEAFGNTLNEAMYFRKAIVTHSTPHSDNGQLEQVEHFKNGLIANYPETFAQAIIYLLKNPKTLHSLGLAGHKKVVTELSPKLTTHRLEKIYLSMFPSSKLSIMQKIWRDSIEYFPTPNQIKNFPQEYQRKLGQEFGDINFWMYIREIGRLPRRVISRAMDYYYFNHG